jgi:lipoate-protein ligase B
MDVVPAGNGADDVATATEVTVTEADSVFTTGADWVHPADIRSVATRSPVMKTARSGDISIQVGGERK